jgi:hypothetical protein
MATGSEARDPVGDTAPEVLTVETDVDELLGLIQRGKAAIFCGAGISRRSGIPIVHDIESYLLETLGAPAEETELVLGSSLPFEAFMEALAGRRDIAGLLGIFSGGEPNANHRLIAQLAKAGLLKTIDTTNFDLLIEDALEAVGLRDGLGLSRHIDRNQLKTIDWSPAGGLRLIKLHGSIERPEDIAVTLRLVAGKVWTEGTQSVIERTFSTGDHEAVLILGYSCSDLFDLSPQIEALDGPQKRVVLVDHTTDAPSAEDLALKADKNPFRRWKNGRRLRVDTDWLTGRIREKCLASAPDIPGRRLRPTGAPSSRPGRPTRRAPQARPRRNISSQPSWCASRRLRARARISSAASSWSPTIACAPNATSASRSPPRKRPILPLSLRTPTPPSRLVRRSPT